jgi:hypothetical protein
MKKFGLIVLWGWLCFSSSAIDIKLQWNQNQESIVTGYNLYFSTNGTKYQVRQVGNVLGYTLTNVYPGRTYSFYITAHIANNSESPPSNFITYTVPHPDYSIIKPLILQHPESKVVYIGSPVTFFTIVTGAPPINLQWFKGTIAIPNATQDSFTINSVSTNDAYPYYYVSARNINGQTLSAAASLTVTNPPDGTSPLIVNQSGDQEAEEGGPVNLFVTAVGPPPLSYQWYKSGIIMRGANSNTYRIGSLFGNDLGKYYASVRNYYGQVWSTNMIVRFSSEKPPVITSQSGNITVQVGQSFSLSITATGSVPLQYQWFRNNVPIPSSTNTIFSVQSSSLANSGKYSVQVSNAYGSAISTQMEVVVLPPSQTQSVQPVKDFKVLSTDSVDRLK